MRTPCASTDRGIPTAADLVLAVHPFGVASARFTAAAARAGGLGVLDLTGDARSAREQLGLAAEWSRSGFGVRLGDGHGIPAPDLPACVHTVVLAAGATTTAADFPGRRVLAEVTSGSEARDAVAAGAHGLIARGHEAGGRVGELSTFVLLQQLLADEADGLPVWACGGIGEHTAAAAVAGGAVGVVLDTQTALLAEAELPAEITSALSGLGPVWSCDLVDPRPGRVGGLGVKRWGVSTSTFGCRVGVHRPVPAGR